MVPLDFFPATSRLDTGGPLSREKEGEGEGEGEGAGGRERDSEVSTTTEKM